MDLPTTTVAQQHPTSPGFISAFKFYNIILFLFPTCNFNLKSSLFLLLLLILRTFSLFSLLFLSFFFFFFSTPFLLRAALSVLFLPSQLPSVSFFPLYSLIATLLFLFLFLYSFSSSSFFGLYWIQHENWFYRLNPMHQEQSKRGLIIIFSTLIYMI